MNESRSHHFGHSSQGISNPYQQQRSQQQQQQQQPPRQQQPAAAPLAHQPFPQHRPLQQQQEATRPNHSSNEPNNRNQNNVSFSAAPVEHIIKCMTVFTDGKRIAFACYHEDTNEILLEDCVICNRDEIETFIHSFLSIARPNLILISTKVASDSQLMTYLTQNPLEHDMMNAATANRNGNATPNTRNSNIPYQLLRSKAFDLKNCKQLILNQLRVLSLFHSKQNQDPTRQFPNNLQTYDSSSNYHAISSIVNFDSPTLLKALGSLLFHLQSTIYSMEDGNTVTVNQITHVQSNKYMKIDSETLFALHIFSNKKKGYSLYTLLNRCKSKIGKQCLKKIMLRPLLDPVEIQKRQDGVELFLKSSVKEVVARLNAFLMRIGSVDSILHKIAKCTTSPLDFVVLMKGLGAMISIVDILNNDLRNILIGQVRALEQQERTEQTEAEMYLLRRQIALVENLVDECNVAELQYLLDQMNGTIDQEATSMKKDSVVIQYGVYQDLDNDREIYDRMDEILRNTMLDLLRRWPQFQDLTVTFISQVGFLIRLDKRNVRHDAETNSFPDLPQDFRFMFTQDDDIYFKNPDIEEIDADIGNVDTRIRDKEQLIVNELEEDIFDSEHHLRNIFQMVANLDCLLSFANCSEDLNFVRPEIIPASNDTSDDSILIENGRHPLQELIVDSDFIPNSTVIDETRRMNIVTGPNYSGKSCYTRQVGIIVYMAHLGCFVPCDQARISVTDQILARISSVETCSIPQSSFQLDLTQMATILHRSTSNSLVLIDEFGKGTSPVSGIAVLTAALKKLISIKCKVVCTTHFMEIFSLNLLKDGVDNLKVLHMAVFIPDTDGEEEEEAVPLFKLEEGIAKSSAGVICAKMAGVHEDVTLRAREILGALKNGNKVKPVPAKMNSNSVFQPQAKAALRHFLANNSWKDEEETELTVLQKKISLM